jgi:hypothetical protein
MGRTEIRSKLRRISSEFGGLVLFQVAVILMAVGVVCGGWVIYRTIGWGVILLIAICALLAVLSYLFTLETVIAKLLSGLVSAGVIIGISSLLAYAGLWHLLGPVILSWILFIAGLALVSRTSSERPCGASRESGFL